MTYRHSLVFAAACVGMLLFGVTLTTLGSILPSIMPRHGLDRASAGSLLAVMSMAILAASLVFGPIVDRHGYKGVLIAGALGVSAGLAGIAFAPSSWLLALAVFAFGFSGGLINGSTNALVSDISSQARGSGLSLLGVFFGIGAFGVPLVLGLLLKYLDYATVLALFSLAALLPVVMFSAISFPPPKQPQGFPLRKAGSLLRERSLLLLGFMLFFQSGMEITLGGWSAEFAHEALRLDASHSVLVLSTFWIGMMVARLLLAPLLQRLPATTVLIPLMMLTVLGTLILLTSDGEQQAMIGLFVTGFGLAAGFPIVLGVIGEVYSELTGSAFSIAFVMALLGGSVVSYLTGLLADRYGLRASLFTVVTSQIMMGILVIHAALPGQPHAHLLTKWKESTHARA